MAGNYLIAYTSMTGNTEEIAEEIAEGIRRAGVNVEIKDILVVDAEDLLHYDGILLGTYTWGDGDLPDEFLDFYEEMDQLNLTGVKAAVFGSYDSSYGNMGNAVNILMEKLTVLGARVVLEGLKIELAPTDEEKVLCRQFGKDFVMKR